MLSLLSAVLLAAVAAALNKDQMAEITFHDSASKLHTVHQQYYIDNERIQYGVKFGVMVYRIAFEACKASVPANIEEYFAAEVQIPDSCNAQEVIQDLENHGADFIFVDAKKSALGQNGKLLSNRYQVPVFFVERSDDVFLLDASKGGKQYINIFFEMVS